MKDKGGDLKHVSKKTEIPLKSRHFAHKGASSQGVKPAESSQDLKTQEIKPNALHGSVQLGKDFSAEKKLVMQQMAVKEKPKDSSSLQDEASDKSRTTELNESSEKAADSYSAASNAEVSKGSGNPPSSVKQCVYSSAEIKPRNSTLVAASIIASRTISQPEERTNLAPSDKNSVVEEDSKAKVKATGAASNTSHLVAANYSFFPADNEESELDQPKNAKVIKSV